MASSPADDSIAPSTPLVSKNQLIFNQNLVDFIIKIKQILPSEANLFAKYYKYYRKMVDNNQRCEFIAEFVGYISKYTKEINECDEGLFSEEESYYPKKPIQLLKGIDFKKIWAHPELTSVTKQSIWDYLKSMYVIGQYVLKENEKFKELAIMNAQIIKKMINSMKIEQDIRKTVAESPDTEDIDTDDKAEGSDKIDMTKISGTVDQMFDSNNPMVQIAKNVASSINLDGLKNITTPGGIISALTNKDMISTLSTTVKKEIDAIQSDGKFTQEQLAEYSKDAMSSTKLFKNIGIGGDLFGQLRETITSVAIAKKDGAEVSSTMDINQIIDGIKAISQNMLNMGIEGNEINDLVKNLKGMLNL